MGKRGREQFRVDGDGDVDMLSPRSPPSKKSSMHVARSSASLGVLTHVVSDLSRLPSPLEYFDQAVSATCYRQKYVTEQGAHFVVGALATNPHPEEREEAILIMMGSCDDMDYVAHLALRMSAHVRILRAWAQTIRCLMPESPSSRGDPPTSSSLASPLARFVRDVTGKQLHLACALTHCNMRPPFNTRSPPMMKLGCLANTVTLEDAVSLSRLRRFSAQLIQRCYRRYRSRVAKRSACGRGIRTNVLAGLMSELTL